MSGSKRQDLQGIRGLAILSVLGFHFYPQLFPNGYLGVDQFFVLSGFLMCMLLSKTEHLPVLSVLGHFYSRRFKRILPLYLLVVLLVLLALYSVFPDSAVLQNQASATKALFFVSNRPHTGEEDYFEKLSLAIDLFTHTWSLSVEIQFYFLVPAIFIIANCFPESLKYAFYALLGVSSFSYYVSSPKEIAFNSVFARIWQFVIGMAIFLTSSNVPTPLSLPYKILESDEKNEVLLPQDDGFDELEEQEREEENDQSAVLKRSSFCGPFPKYFFLVPMIYIVSYPLEMPSVLLRPLFTVFTGILMLLSIDDEYLSNRVLTYLGDISYSLYLIHWPMLAYSKLTFPGNEYVLTASLISSVLLAILVFETFEKWYLRLSNTSITVLIILLFVTNVVLIHKDVIHENFKAQKSNSNFKRLDGVLPNMTFDDAVRLNNYWSSTDLGGLNEPGCEKRTPGKVWCDFNGTSSQEKGGYKIAIFGNSVTENHHKMFLQECRYRAYNVTMYSEYGCEALAALSNEAHCKKHLVDFVDFLKSARPDYGFIFTRFFATGVPFTNNITDLSTDATYKEMQNQMKQFVPLIKKKLFVLDAFPRTNRWYVGDVAKDLKKGKDLAEIHKKLVDLSTYELARLRTEAVVRECGAKCELIDYQPLLFNKSMNRFEFFDSKGFVYFTSVNHMSAHGMELVRPIYTKICAELK